MMKQLSDELLQLTNYFFSKPSNQNKNFHKENRSVQKNVTQFLASPFPGNHFFVAEWVLHPFNDLGWSHKPDIILGVQEILKPAGHGRE